MVSLKETEQVSGYHSQPRLFPFNVDHTPLPKSDGGQGATLAARPRWNSLRWIEIHVLGDANLIPV